MGDVGREDLEFYERGILEGVDLAGMTVGSERFSQADKAMQGRRRAANGCGVSCDVYVEGHVNRAEPVIRVQRAGLAALPVSEARPARLPPLHG